MEDSIRRNLTSVIDSLQLSGQIRELDKYQWKHVLANIELKFITRPLHSRAIYWYWEHFNNQFSLTYPNNDGYKYLHELINKNEKVWIIVEEKESSLSFGFMNQPLNLYKKLSKIAICLSITLLRESMNGFYVKTIMAF